MNADESAEPAPPPHPAIAALDRAIGWAGDVPAAILVALEIVLLLAGDAPSALNIEVQSGLTGTRILKPFRSADVTIGLVEVVIWRKPLSQILSKATRLALPIAART